MRIQDEHITNTTITPSAEQRASGAFSKPVHQGPPSRFSQIGHFLWHFVQMCLACCIGGAALIGYPDLIQRFPELSTVVIAFLLALAMAAWMRFRGHEWRPTLEISGATIVAGILLIGLACLACPVMLVVMLLRLDLYTGRKGHHAQAA